MRPSRPHSYSPVAPPFVPSQMQIMSNVFKKSTDKQSIRFTGVGLDRMRLYLPMHFPVHVYPISVLVALTRCFLIFHDFSNLVESSYISRTVACRVWKSIWQRPAGLVDNKQDNLPALARSDSRRYIPYQICQARFHNGLHHRH